MENLSLRYLAKIIGVSPSTLVRMAGRPSTVNVDDWLTFLKSKVNYSSYYLLLLNYKNKGKFDVTNINNIKKENIKEDIKENMSLKDQLLMAKIEKEQLSIKKIQHQTELEAQDAALKSLRSLITIWKSNLKSEIPKIFDEIGIAIDDAKLDVIMKHLVNIDI